MNYYPHHIGDYLRDTAHLSMIEDSAYRRMLDLYYASEKPLPLDIGGLYRLVRAKSKQEREAVDTILEEYFRREETGWHNSRADREIGEWQSKCNKAKASAAVRWQSERNANAYPNASQTQCQTDANQNQNQNQKKRVGRAERLPTSWSPSEILEAWAVKERPDLDIAYTVERFRDYWVAVPGSRGCKLDWEATFRNWVRAEKPGRRTAEQIGEVI